MALTIDLKQRLDALTDEDKALAILYILIGEEDATKMTALGEDILSVRFPDLLEGATAEEKAVALLYEVENHLREVHAGVRAERAARQAEEQEREQRRQEIPERHRPQRRGEGGPPGEGQPSGGPTGGEPPGRGRP